MPAGPPPTMQQPVRTACAEKFPASVIEFSPSDRAQSNPSCAALPCVASPYFFAVSALARLPGRRFLLVCQSNGLETQYAVVAREAAGASWHRPW